MVARNSVFTGQQGAVWVQPEGPNTAVRYLGCYEAGDITIPEGDITSIRCPDPAMPGKWITVAQSVGIPDDPTFSLNGLLSKAASYLERYSCPMPVYIKQSMTGRKDVFLTYDRVVALRDSRRTSHSMSNLVQREGTDASEESFDFTTAGVEVVYPMSIAQQTTTDITDATDVIFVNDLTCRSEASKFMVEATDGFVATDGAAGIANLLVTRNGGSTWANVVGPFGAGEPIAALAAAPVSEGVIRLFAANGAAGAGAAEIAYTDDYGATWTNVLVGVGVGDFIQWNGAMIALDLYHAWVGTDAGDIYFSNDAGVSWTEQGSTMANGINCIRFADEEHGLFVGDLNSVYYTQNGGASWTAIVGPSVGDNLMTCWILDSVNWWVGNDDGELWYTFDGGDNWAQRTFTIPGTPNRVNDVYFLNELIGFAAVKHTVGADVFGAIMRTFDGGTNWEVYSTDELDVGALGLVALHGATANKVFGAGDLLGAIAGIWVATD